MMRVLAAILVVITGGLIPAETACAGTASHAQPAATITVRDAAEAAGHVVLLGDIADVNSANATLQRALTGVEVGTAPLVGGARTISAGYVRIRVRQLGVPMQSLQFAGAATVTVTRPSQMVAGATMEQAARDAIAASQPGIVAQVAFPLRDLQVPRGTVELRAAPVRPGVGATVVVPVEVVVNGRAEARALVSLRVVRSAGVVVLARDVASGAVLTNDDLRVEQRPQEPGARAIETLAAAAGQELVTAGAAGTALTARMVRKACLVRRGARVKLVCRGPGFTVASSGEALQDAAAGQGVRVRVSGSLHDVTGSAVGPDTVEVPF